MLGRQLTLAFTILQLTGCGSRNATPDSTRSNVDPDAPVSIRFAIELTNGTDGPIYVSLTGASNQLGWVTATRDGERIYFGERCEIEDCGAPPAVCGAAIPMVRNIAIDEDRTIAFVWDGLTSAIDPSLQCERRQPAPPGSYVARLCYARETTIQRGDAPGPMAGSVRNPTCVDRPFTLGDREVVLKI